MARKAPGGQTSRAETYRHEEEALLRPEVGTQAQFRKRKPPKTSPLVRSMTPATRTFPWPLPMFQKSTERPSNSV